MLVNSLFALCLISCAFATPLRSRQVDTAAIRNGTFPSRRRTARDQVPSPLICESGPGQGALYDTDTMTCVCPPNSLVTSTSGGPLSCLTCPSNSALQTSTTAPGTITPTCACSQPNYQYDKATNTCYPPSAACPDYRSIGLLLWRTQIDPKTSSGACIYRTATAAAALVLCEFAKGQAKATGDARCPKQDRLTQITQDNGYCYSTCPFDVSYSTVYFDIASAEIQCYPSNRPAGVSVTYNLRTGAFIRQNRTAGEFNNLVSSPGICATPAQTA